MTTTTTATTTPRATAPRTVEPPDCQAQPSAERVSCRQCGKTFTGGSVVTLMPGRGQTPGWSARLRHHFVVRLLYCDHCDHIQSWDQACDARGNVEDAVISARPIFIKRRADIDWHLSTYPQLQGVNQS